MHVRAAWARTLRCGGVGHEEHMYMYVGVSQDGLGHVIGREPA